MRGEPRCPVTILVASLSLGLWVSACSQPSTPATPTPPVATPPPPAPQTFVTLGLTGFIRDDDDLPVAGATVKVTGVEPASMAVTDAHGFYSTSATINASYVIPLAWVSIRKDGYDAVENAAIFEGRRDMQVDFRIFRRLTIPAGTNRTLPIGFDGPLCGFELEYPCRHVEVSASSRGTLVIETVADTQTERFPFGPVTYPFKGATQLSVQVSAGQTVPVEILWAWSGGGWTPSRRGSFTLNTSLVP